MFFRFGSKSGKAVPPAGQALEDIHSQLQQQQPLWTEKLAHDPSCFAALEQEVHLRFGQLGSEARGVCEVRWFDVSPEHLRPVGLIQVLLDRGAHAELQAVWRELVRDRLPGQGTHGDASLL